MSSKAWTWKGSGRMWEKMESYRKLQVVLGKRCEVYGPMLCWRSTVISKGFRSKAQILAGGNLQIRRRDYGTVYATLVDFGIFRVMGAICGAQSMFHKTGRRWYGILKRENWSICEWSEKSSRRDEERFHIPANQGTLWNSSSPWSAVTRSIYWSFQARVQWSCKGNFRWK